MSTKLFRMRIDADCLAECDAAAAELGTTPAELCRMFLSAFRKDFAAGKNKPGVAPWRLIEAAKLDTIRELWDRVRVQFPPTSSQGDSSAVKKLDEAIRGSKNPAGQAAAGNPVVRDKGSER